MLGLRAFFALYLREELTTLIVENLNYRVSPKEECYKITQIVLLVSW